MKRITTIFLIAGLCVSLSVSTAWSGSGQRNRGSGNVQRYRWEGNVQHNRGSGNVQHNRGSGNVQRNRGSGNVQRNRWEGVAIGLGAALLGSALVNQYHQSHAIRSNPAPVPPAGRYRNDYGRQPDYRDYRPARPRGGHWEIQKRWVPAKRLCVWNPGHYNQRGQWVQGGWTWIDNRSGHWENERIWVSYR